MLYFITTLRNLFPLSLRGLCILGIAIWAFYEIAQKQRDIFLHATIGTSFLYLAFAIIAGLFNAFTVRKKITNSQWTSIGNIHARNQETLHLCGCNFSPMPLFSLKLSPSFFKEIPTQKKVTIRPAIFSGKLNQSLPIIVSFPHRGYWKISKLHWTLEDGTGLVKISGSLPLPYTIEVLPKERLISTPTLPLTASSGKTRDGGQKRTGDYYDTRQYTPGDRLALIDWKAYARIGKLVSRQPERALDNFKHYSIFAIAKPEEDRVASFALSMCAHLSRDSVPFSFATDATTNFASSLIEAKKLSAENVWSKNAGTGKGIEEVIKRSNRAQVSALIFVSSSNDSGWEEQVMSAMQRTRITTTIIFCPKNEDYCSAELALRHSGYDVQILSIDGNFK